jgi:transcriptional regulator with XRE-family HTH domain
MSIYPNGYFIQLTRVEKLLTKYELAKIAGLAPATVSRIEAGKGIGFPVLRKVLTALEVAPDICKEFWQNEPYDDLPTAPKKASKKPEKLSKIQKLAQEARQKEEEEMRIVYPKGEFFRAEREKAKLTVLDVSNYSEIPMKTIASMEDNEPVPFYCVQQVLEALEVEPRFHELYWSSEPLRQKIGPVPLPDQPKISSPPKPVEPAQEAKPRKAYEPPKVLSSSKPLKFSTAAAKPKKEVLTKKAARALKKKNAQKRP